MIKENTYSLYCTSAAVRLSEEVARLLDTPIRQVHSEKFSDGELFVRFDESIRGQTVLLIAKAHMPYENMMEMLLTIDAARRSSAREVIVVIPFLPHSRQERRDGERTSVSARVIADMIQLMGADRIITIDLHSNAIEGFYKIPVDPLASVKLFAEKIKSLNLEKLCLCSPDFGGIRRIKLYHKLLESDMAVIHKERLKPNQVAHMEVIGDVSGKDVVIIDDMIDTAGTLCKAADLLMQQGARTVRAFCTHGVLSGGALERIEQSSLLKVYIADTVLEVVKSDKIQVISSAPLLARAIEGLLQNKSLREL